MKDTSSTYKHSQSLGRGLDVLAAINRIRSGSATPARISIATGLHRTTVKRLLETLTHEGYLSFDNATGEYRVTIKVQALSAGFHDLVWITETAWPTLRRLSRQVVWPCTLLTLEGDEMVVRASTHAYSPLSFHPGVPGRRLPLLSTGAGRAYLSFCPDNEFAILMEMLQAHDGRGGELAAKSDYVESIRHTTRRQGFGLNRGEWALKQKFGGIAVPIRHKSRVLACINIVYLTGAVHAGEAENALARQLKEAGAEIESRFALEHDI